MPLDGDDSVVKERRAARGSAAGVSDRLRFGEAGVAELAVEQVEVGVDGALGAGRFGIGLCAFGAMAAGDEAGEGVVELAHFAFKGGLPTKEPVGGADGAGFFGEDDGFEVHVVEGVVGDGDGAALAEGADLFLEEAHLEEEGAVAAECGEGELGEEFAFAIGGRRKLGLVAGEELLVTGAKGRDEVLDGGEEAGALGVLRGAGLALGGAGSGGELGVGAIGGDLGRGGHGIRPFHLVSVENQRRQAEACRRRGFQPLQRGIAVSPPQFEYRAGVKAEKG